MNAWDVNNVEGRFRTRNQGRLGGVLDSTELRAAGARRLNTAEELRQLGLGPLPRLGIVCERGTSCGRHPHFVAVVSNN